LLTLVISAIAKLLIRYIDKIKRKRVGRISIYTIVIILLLFLFIYSIYQLSQYQSDRDATLPTGMDFQQKNIGAAWNNMGFILYSEGRNNEAIECFDNATNINPDYVLAWSNKAEALIALQRNSEAEVVLNKAKRIFAKELDIKRGGITP